MLLGLRARSDHTKPLQKLTLENKNYELVTAMVSQRWGRTGVRVSEVAHTWRHRWQHPVAVLAVTENTLSHIHTRIKRNTKCKTWAVCFCSLKTTSVNTADILAV